MTHDPNFLEAQLRELHVRALDEALLSRLEAAADGTLTTLSHQEIRFEAVLRKTSPARLSPDFMAQLEAIVHEVPFAVNEKIVLFPKANTAVPHRRQRPLWGAAAAVALIGAITALLMPAGKTSDKLISQVTQVSSPVARPASGNFVPASFDRGVSEVHDEGVVWKSNNQPHSLVRVVYKDKITLRDKQGRTFQVEQPRVEYMLVPAKTN